MERTHIVTRRTELADEESFMHCLSTHSPAPVKMPLTPLAAKFLIICFIFGNRHPNKPVKCVALGY